MKKHDHFKGRSALEHLVDARAKAARETDAMHGIEAPGHIVAFCDVAKETTFVAILTWILWEQFALPIKTRWLLLLLALFGWLIWKVGRSAIHGWGRLNKLHRVIEEERNEIQNNREQEREELFAMYKAKGFSGKLLDDVISVLMADDNRLLNIMLEEELGLCLESYEHPLKQACGAGFGVIISAAILFVGALIGNHIGIYIAALLIVLLSSLQMAKMERNPYIPAIVWNVTVFVLASGATFFLTKFFIQG